MHYGFNLVHNTFQLWRGHGPLLARFQKPLQNFLPFESLAPSVLLDHHVRNFVDALVGSESPAALQPLAPAANGIAAGAFPRINYLVIFVRAKRKLHEATSPCIY